MTADSKLRAAIRWALEWADGKHPGQAWGAVRLRLEAALASEPEVPDAPKVERVKFGYVAGDLWTDQPGRTHFPEPGWVYYAERPIPAKSRQVELADELRLARENWSDPEVKPSRSALLDFLRRAEDLLREKP